MALDSSKVRVAVSGAVSKGATSAAAPTGTASALTGFTDLGYVSEDGVSIALPDSGDAEAIKAWQNGATVRTIRTPSDENPTYTFTLLETKKEVVETYFGVTVTTAATEGSFEIDTQDARGYDSYVLDVIDGAELIRVYIPKGIVASVGDQVYANGEPIGYEVTIDAERNDTLGYNAKQWATALKT